MGLILPQKVKIKITNRNRWCYYKQDHSILKLKKGEELLYDFDVTNLYKGSYQKVNIECDLCHNVITRAYREYAKRNRNGKYYCHDCNNKLLSGDNSPNWNSNKTNEKREKDRYMLDSSQSDFAKKVYARDNYTCQVCGSKTNLQAHHIESYNSCVEKRSDVTNGITLCKNCHQNFHSIYKKGNNTKEQFQEWLNISNLILDDYDGILPTKKEIICYETKMIFKNADEAAKYYDVKVANIYACCISNSGEAKRKIPQYTVCGMHLFWLTSYNKMDNAAIQKIVKHIPNNWRKIININDGMSFKSIADASRYYNINQATLKWYLSGACKSHKEFIYYEQQEGA